MTAAGAPTLAIDQDRLPSGHPIGAYRIIEPLGDGGMGVVYVAEHTLIGRRVAIKILRAEYGAQPQVVERFFNEARVTTAIRHPGIVEVFDFGCTAANQPYIVMELLAGQSLAARLADVALPPIEALAIAADVASALAAAHANGVVHRDLKPDNVFLVNDTGGERVKLLDFGIAKLDGGSLAARTRTGLLLGTPQYMSPEQCRGAGACDHRSDIYSLGCVLFEMLAGRAPFTGDLAELLTGHVHRPPPPLHAPAPIATLVERMLAKDPAQRPSSAAELVEELDRLVELERTQPSIIGARAELANTRALRISRRSAHGSYARSRSSLAVRDGRRPSRVIVAVATACVIAGMAVFGGWQHAGVRAEAPIVTLDVGAEPIDDVTVRATTTELAVLAPAAAPAVAPPVTPLQPPEKKVEDVSDELLKAPRVGVDTPVP